jgi:hypothetical protein
MTEREGIQMKAILVITAFLSNGNQIELRKQSPDIDHCIAVLNIVQERLEQEGIKLKYDLRCDVEIE